MYIKYSQALSSTEALARILKHIKRAVDNAKRGLFPLSVVPPPPPPPARGLIFPLPSLPTTQTESQATTTAKLRKRHLKTVFALLQSLSRLFHLV